MKITNNEYPIIKKMKEKSLGVVPIYEDDKPFFDFYMETFNKNWKYYNDFFSKNLFFVTKPFLNSVKKAQPKLFELWGEIVTKDTSDFDISSTFIIGDWVYMIDYHIKKGSENNELSFYVFDKKGIPLIMYVDSHNFKIYQTAWVSKIFSTGIENDKIFALIMNELHTCIIVEMFREFSQVESKFLEKNKRIKDINCKYLNQTDFDITYLDSKWFTNLINSNEFSVRGHFRLQPKKMNGKWTKDLIWINEFKKSGYNLTAKKDNYEIKS